MDNIFIRADPEDKIMVDGLLNYLRHDGFSENRGAADYDFIESYDGCKVICYNDLKKNTKEVMPCVRRRNSRIFSAARKR